MRKQPLFQARAQWQLYFVAEYVWSSSDNSKDWSCHFSVESRANVRRGALKILIYSWFLYPCEECFDENGKVIIVCCYSLEQDGG